MLSSTSSTVQSLITAGSQKLATVRWPAAGEGAASASGRQRVGKGRAARRAGPWALTELHDVLLPPAEQGKEGGEQVLGRSGVGCRGRWPACLLSLSTCGTVTPCRKLER